MKKLLIIMLLLVSATAYGQTYYVYSVSGKVTENATGKSKSVTPKMTITDVTNLSVADGSRIVLVNEAKKQMYTVRGTAKGTVKQLLAGKSASIKTVSPQYIAVLMKKSSGATSNRSSYMQSAATSFRDLDSLLIQSDSIMPQNDSLRAKKAP